MITSILEKNIKPIIEKIKGPLSLYFKRNFININEQFKQIKYIINDMYKYKYKYKYINDIYNYKYNNYDIKYYLESNNVNFLYPAKLVISNKITNEYLEITDYHNIYYDDNIYIKKLKYKNKKYCLIKTIKNKTFDYKIKFNKNKIKYVHVEKIINNCKTYLYNNKIYLKLLIVINKNIILYIIKIYKYKYIENNIKIKCVFKNNNYKYKMNYIYNRRFSITF